MALNKLPKNYYMHLKETIKNTNEPGRMILESREQQEMETNNLAVGWHIDKRGRMEV